MVGDERIHKQSDASLLFTDGASGLAYFAYSGCGGSPWTCELHPTSWTPYTP